MSPLVLDTSIDHSVLKNRAFGTCQKSIASPTFSPSNRSCYVLLYLTFSHLSRASCASCLHSLFPLVVCHNHTKKAFDTVYLCFAAADEPLLLPSLERFKRLGIVNITWRPERENNETESKRLIRESSVFQICWSISAKVSSRVHLNLRVNAHTNFRAPCRRWRVDIAPPKRDISLCRSTYTTKTNRETERRTAALHVGL